MTTEVNTLADRLRGETRELHGRAEGHRFQQDMLAGRLDRSIFVDSLEQWLCIHQTLESGLRRHCNVPQIRRVVRDYQFHEARLREDLKFFGRDPDRVWPLPAVITFADAVEATAANDPACLLGYHYVLEGSKNGSKHIARILQRVYDLQPGPGLLYQDPYGDAQREYWQAFRTDLAAAEFTMEQEEDIVEAAKLTFEAVIALMEELHSEHETI